MKHMRIPKKQKRTKATYAVAGNPTTDTSFMNFSLIKLNCPKLFILSILYVSSNT